MKRLANGDAILAIVYTSTVGEDMDIGALRSKFAVALCFVSPALAQYTPCLAQSRAAIAAAGTMLLHCGSTVGRGMCLADRIRRAPSTGAEGKGESEVK